MNFKGLSVLECAFKTEIFGKFNNYQMYLFLKSIPEVKDSLFYVLYNQS